MINTYQFTQCPKCSSKLGYISVIDVSSTPDLFAKFMADELNPKACTCGLSASFETPLVVLSKHWICVVLANPQPIPFELACEVVSTFLAGTPGLSPPNMPVFVTGPAKHLRRMIRNASGDRFCAVRFDAFTMPNWSAQISMLEQIADFYLLCGKPEFAYWDLSEAMDLVNELYFDTRFADALELTALAAGDRIAEGLREPRTAAADLKARHQLLEPRRPTLAPWIERTYLCFYEDDHAFAPGAPFLWAADAELLRLEPDGRVFLNRSERHAFAGSLQAIIPREPPRIGRAVLNIFGLLLIRRATTQRLADTQGELRAALEQALTRLDVDWEISNGHDREILYKAYSQWTDGCDLIQDFGLPTKGFYLRQARLAGEDR